VKTEISQVIKMLGHSDADVREFAAGAFKKLLDYSSTVSHSAAAVFDDALKAGVPGIVEMLWDDDREVRTFASGAFGKLVNDGK
jgi:hypothetical protein